MQLLSIIHKEILWSQTLSHESHTEFTQEILIYRMEIETSENVW